LTVGEKPIYKVIFRNNDQLLEVYTSAVSQGPLFGFVELESLLFGERSQVVVDPTEEQIKNEFRGAKRIYLPLHSVVRIDMVEKQGVSRVAGKVEGQENLMPFPTPLPGGSPGKKPSK